MKDYQRARVDFHRARAAARREHPQPCDCPYCITPARARELIQQRLTAQAERNGEVPF